MCSDTLTSVWTEQQCLCSTLSQLYKLHTAEAFVKSSIFLSGLFPCCFFFFLQVCEISWQQLFFCLWVSTTSADARVIHSDVHAKFKKHGTSPRLYLRNHASSLWLFPLRRTKQAYPRELRRTLIEAKEMAPLWSVVRGLELTLSIKTRHGWISFVSHVTGRLLSFNTSARQLWRGRFLFCQHE